MGNKSWSAFVKVVLVGGEIRNKIKTSKIKTSKHTIVGHCYLLSEVSRENLKKTTELTRSLKN